MIAKVSNARRFVTADAVMRSNAVPGTALLA